jgi:hypothetical protein
VLEGEEAECSGSVALRRSGGEGVLGEGPEGRGRQTRRQESEIGPAI